MNALEKAGMAVFAAGTMLLVASTVAWIVVTAPQVLAAFAAGYVAAFHSDPLAVTWITGFLLMIPGAWLFMIGVESP